MSNEVIDEAELDAMIDDENIPGFEDWPSAENEQHPKDLSQTVQTGDGGKWDVEMPTRRLYPSLHEETQRQKERNRDGMEAADSTRPSYPKLPQPSKQEKKPPSKAEAYANPEELKGTKPKAAEPENLHIASDEPGEKPKTDRPGHKQSTDDPKPNAKRKSVLERIKVFGGRTKKPEGLKGKWKEVMEENGFSSKEARACAKILAANNITDEDAINLNDGDLQRIGIKSESHRSRLLAMIKALMEEVDKEELAQNWYHVLVENGIPTSDAAKYAQMLVDNKVTDTNARERLSDEVLLNMGILNALHRKSIIDMVIKLTTPKVERKGTDNDFLTKCWYDVFVENNLEKDAALKYAILLSDNQVTDENALKVLNDATLTHFGITSSDHRRFILELVQRLSNEAYDEVDEDDYLATCWYEVMRENGLSEAASRAYAKRFSEHNIDDTNAGNMTEQDLINIGVSSQIHRHFLLILIQKLIKEAGMEEETEETVPYEAQSQDKVEQDLENVVEKTSKATEDQAGPGPASGQEIDWDAIEKMEKSVAQFEALQDQIAKILAGNTPRQRAFRAKLKRERKAREEARAKKRHERAMKQAEKKLARFGMKS